MFSMMVFLNVWHVILSSDCCYVPGVQMAVLRKAVQQKKKEYGIMPRGFIGSGSALLPVWSSWPFRVNEEGSMNTCIHGSFFLYPVKYHGLRSTEKKTTISDNTFHRCGIFFTLL